MIACIPSGFAPDRCSITAASPLTRNVIRTLMRTPPGSWACRGDRTPLAAAPWLLRLADQVVHRTPPAREADVVAPALTGDDEDVAVARLTQTLVRPDDDG